jgi:hypothetical protein
MLTPDQIRGLVRSGYKAGIDHYRKTGQATPPARGWPGCKDQLKSLAIADMPTAASIYDAAAQLGVEHEIDSHQRA